MKRLLPVLMIALLASACGGSTPATETPATESPVAEVTPVSCAVAPLPCAPERVLVMPVPNSPDGMMIVFENGTGLTNSRANDSSGASLVQVWSWGAEATAPLFAAFDGATVLLTVPTGGYIDPAGDDLVYTKGRWAETDMIIALSDDTTIRGLLMSIPAISAVWQYDKKTGKVIMPGPEDGLLSSVTDLNTLFVINPDLSGTITRDGAAVQAAATALSSAGTPTDLTDKFLTTQREDASGEATGYVGILPDWLSPQSQYWDGIYTPIGN